MQKDRENYCACLQILLFCAVSECYARVFEGRLVFDLDRAAELERCLELQADIKLLKDPVGELNKLREAGQDYIVDNSPYKYTSAYYAPESIAALAERVQYARDNF